MLAFAIYRSAGGSRGPAVGRVVVVGGRVSGSIDRELFPFRQQLRRAVAAHAAGPFADMSQWATFGGQTYLIDPTSDVGRPT